jgi:hypothetical protein
VSTIAPRDRVSFLTEDNEEEKDCSSGERSPQAIPDSTLQRFNGLSVFAFFRVTSRQISDSTPVNGHK